MAAAALITGATVAFVLGRQLLGALTATGDKLASQRRAVSKADKRASQAERAAAEAKRKEAELAKRLKSAVETVRKQESEAPSSSSTRPAPPAPPEPPLFDVELGDAEIHKPPAATLEQLGNEKPTKRQWAENLYAYALREIREGRAAGLGSKGNPNERVKAAQSGMGKLDDDGIYGDKTRARGRELTGKKFPARTDPKAPAPPSAPVPNLNSLANLNVFQKPKPEAPKQSPSPVTQRPTGPRPGTPVAKRAPVEAANDLLKYVRKVIGDGKASTLGSKANPNETVKAAQADMGAIKVDGAYGPETRQRGKALTGETFPARV